MSAKSVCDKGSLLLGQALTHKLDLEVEDHVSLGLDWEVCVLFEIERVKLCLKEFVVAILDCRFASPGAVRLVRMVNEWFLAF